MLAFDNMLRTGVVFIARAGGGGENKVSVSLVGSEVLKPWRSTNSALFEDIIVVSGDGEDGVGFFHCVVSDSWW